MYLGILYIYYIYLYIYYLYIYNLLGENYETKLSISINTTERHLPYFKLGLNTSINLGYCQSVLHIFKNIGNSLIPSPGN